MQLLTDLSTDKKKWGVVGFTHAPIKTKYKEEFIFIHVDIYDDPQQVQSNFENAKISHAVKEWNLPTSLWTFIVAGNGQIKYRFEAFASESEIENALNQVY